MSQQSLNLLFIGITFLLYIVIAIRSSDSNKVLSRRRIGFAVSEWDGYRG